MPPVPNPLPVHTALAGATWARWAVAAALLGHVVLSAAPAKHELTAPAQAFIEDHCASCHDDTEKKGGLDLTSLTFQPGEHGNFSTWAGIFDRVTQGEMPPKRKPRPEHAALSAFTGELSAALLAVEAERMTREGRATRRRLNRYEYENSLRDLLGAPWLQVKEGLPEDGEAHRFNKSGDALDVSHVQMARYLGVGDYALRQVIATQAERPELRTVKHYAREQGTFTGPMKFSFFNTSPERATFPVLGTHGQPEVRSGKQPFTVGTADPAQRELEGAGVMVAED